MSLTDALREVRTLRDLPGLMAALGHEPLWESLEPRPGEAATVARSGDFTWLALESDSPAAEARSTARRFAAQGRLMGVIAFYRCGRELAIAVAFGAVPVLRIELDRPDAVALACLNRLRGAAHGGIIAVASRVADALAGEGPGHAFFREFRAMLERMAGTLPARVPGADRHALALVELTRVLFLYFVQSKGWLAGRPDFLARMVDQTLARRRNVHREFLQPLFFGTLNRPPADRGRTAAALGRIPFLNGGLFEPHALERRWRAGFPNHAWRDAFDRLFERFHFTVSEREGGAIAPDMLGRVFEGVMDPVERHGSGTFYTPAALVRRLFDAALVAAVGSRLGCTDEEARHRLDHRTPAAIGVLERITILDPAVGSGAFLLGALERLAELRDPLRLARAKRGILQRNLFGVDQSAMAVRLTELRLWLAVVADESCTPERVAPLPNLDCLIRQGDSLADPVALGAHGTAAARRVGQLRRRAVAASGPAKTGALRELALAERLAAAAVLEQGEAETRRTIGDLMEAARAPTLFGDRPRLTAAARRSLTTLRAALRTLRAGRRRLAADGELPWFHYQSQFADVFAAGGFDMVIGNPPWVRAEVLAPAVRERLAVRYRWWRSGGGRGFGHRPDLSVAFLERAHELAAPGGALALLVPAKLAAAGYATRARAALTATTTLHAVADLAGDADAGFDATIYPMALVATRRRPASGHRVRSSLETGGGCVGPEQAHLSGAPWVLRGDHAACIARELRQAHPPLSERHTCRLGAKTGADRIFLDPPDGVEPELVRWAVRGRDLTPFHAAPRRTVLWTHDAEGRPLERLPPVAAEYLREHAAALRTRSDFRGGPLWSLFRTGPATGAHRVAWPDLARRLAAAALEDRPDRRLVPLNTCYVIVTARVGTAHALAAWLNSTWTRALASLVAQPASSGYRRFGAATVGSLPLPASVDADASLTTIGVRMAAGESLQSELDDLTAGHLGLDADACNALAAAEHAGDRR
jgi:hypothetical protein